MERDFYIKEICKMWNYRLKYIWQEIVWFEIYTLNSHLTVSAQITCTLSDFKDTFHETTFTTNANNIYRSYMSGQKSLILSSASPIRSRFGSGVAVFWVTSEKVLLHLEVSKWCLQLACQTLLFDHPLSRLPYGELFLCLFLRIFGFRDTNDGLPLWCMICCLLIFLYTIFSKLPINIIRWWFYPEVLSNV